MANRPVFVSCGKNPYVIPFGIDFNWVAGMSLSQKRKNVMALHSAFERRCPGKNVLEISSKSLQEEGVRLSALNLHRNVPSLGKSVSVEHIYQGSKVFAAGGPYTDIYEMDDKVRHKDERLQTSGRLLKFTFDGREYPLRPADAFYNWLYITALLENPTLAEKVLEYDSFTDIAFNPEKGIACQARAAAIFVSLSRMGVIDQCRDYDRFVELVYEGDQGVAGTVGQVTTSAVQTEGKGKGEAEKKAELIKYISEAIAEGTVVNHKAWGEGIVKSVSGTHITTEFASLGETKVLEIVFVVTKGIISFRDHQIEEKIKEYLT